MTVARWQPTASWENLRRRARLVADMRAFFAARGVLEVDTPLLATAGSTDPHLASFSTTYRGPGANAGRTLYLQTSPEFAMKRLLAAGSGPIYQICKAFRNGEAGLRHHPEFTLLEWYRPGMDHHQLMDEVDALLGTIAGAPAAKRISYGTLFRNSLDIDPLCATPDELRACAHSHGLAGVRLDAIDDWLTLLFTHLIEPALGSSTPVFVYDYPASQAMLARVRLDEFPVAERFEVYWRGLELGNGFHELTDEAEQRRRFDDDRVRRRRVGLPDMPPDEHLLAALAAGMPCASGIAMGVERLLMAMMNWQTIDETLAFTWEFR